MEPKDVHPIAGEPFYRCLSISQDTEYRDFHYGPPRAPTREVYDYPDDSDVPVYVRDLTDAEFKAAQRAYTRACKEWSETQGIGKVMGPTTITGKFSTEAGAQAEGTWNGDDKRGEWFWTRYADGPLPSGHGPEGDFWPGMRG
jgi:hypothetical protein